VTLEVFDVGGRRVRVLASETQEAGLHERAWDGTDDGGQVLPAGIYWTRLEAGGIGTNRRIVVLK
jgi:flagellar hook assembly protein FlgD